VSLVQAFHLAAWRRAVVVLVLLVLRAGKQLVAAPSQVAVPPVRLWLQGEALAGLTRRLQQQQQQQRQQPRLLYLPPPQG
jgi:hypothetical protein